MITEYKKLAGQKLIKSIIVGLVVFMIVGQFFIVHVQCVDSDGDGISDTMEEELAELYKPSLQFKADERFFPVNVSYHLNNSVLKLWSGESATTVEEDPTVTSISTKHIEYHFLASKFGNVSAIANEYKNNRTILGYTVYGRVTKESEFTVVQYWFFYAYNDAPLNDHEGDWEMIEV